MAKRALKGIDGWLLVFMALLLLTALVNLVLFGTGMQILARWADSAGPTPWPILASSSTYGIVKIVIPLAIFWRMLRVRRWSSVVFAIAGLWLLTAGVPLIDFVVGGWFMPQVYALLPGLMRNILQGGFFALCGTCYLLASMRVANTYPRADSPEVIAQDFE